ncbi:MAG: TlpA disulfide reductase family protein [Alcanivoracaceae bacterium]|nr:TlpA disulfide reductase family protein [Alcanivoracaceae bacterium]
MKNKKLSWLFIASLFLSGWLSAAEVSGPAKDFTLKSTDGSNVKLSELRGEVVMINFWASWCGPCRQELPLLDAIYKEYKDYGFTLLGVNVDEKKEAADKLLTQIPVTFPVLYDPTSSVTELYDVDAMPSTILVDRDGNMRYLHRGYKPGYEKHYDEQVKALVLE